MLRVRDSNIFVNCELIFLTIREMQFILLPRNTKSEERSMKYVIQYYTRDGSPSIAVDYDSKQHAQDVLNYVLLMYSYHCDPVIRTRRNTA